MKGRNRMNRGETKRQRAAITAHTVLIVPASTRKYRNALYFFNFLFTGVGLTCLLLGSYMKYTAEETGVEGSLLPAWLFNWAIGLGVMAIIFGSIGARGAVLTVTHIEQGTQNWYLIGVTMFFTLLLLIELGMGCMLMIEENSELGDQVGNMEERNFIWQTMDEKIEATWKEKQMSWYDWQKTLECCGWKNNTIPAELATGKYCTDDKETTYPACKPKIWALFTDDLFVMAGMLIVFVGIQVVTCCSSYCLACSIQAQEPCYIDN